MNRRNPGRFGIAFMIANLLTGTSAPLPVLAAGKSASVELHVKAAYLFNFGRYIEWPQQTNDVIIGVIGRDPIVEILEKTIAGKTIKGRPYRVKVFGRTDPVEHCEILFLPRSEARYAASLVAALAGRAILTVSDVESFSKDGGMVEFLLLDDTLKFDINVAAAEKAGLKISSELLRVAHEIRGRHH
jgi:hypothetical protein